MKVNRLIRIFLSSTFLCALCADALAKDLVTKLTWHGHAAFHVSTPTGTSFYIDPWLQNPKAPQKEGTSAAYQDVDGADFIFVTHGHFDHIGDAVDIAKKTGARLVTNFELGTNMAALLGYPEKQMGFDSLMNIGGRIKLANGLLTVAMVPAVHSSGLRNPFAKKQQASIAYGGHAAGFVIKIKDGPTLYHSGDTAYYSDMRRIGKIERPDIALLNIGGHFGMEVPDAVRAARSIGARYVIPHHYGTFPILTPDAKEFCRAVERTGKHCLAIKPGESLRFKGSRLLK